MNFYKGSEASKALGVSQATLRKWAEKGRIYTIRTEGGHLRYDVDSYLEKVGV